MLTVEVATLQHKLRLGESSARSSDNTINMLENKIKEKDARIAEWVNLIRYGYDMLKHFYKAILDSVLTGLLSQYFQ